MSQADHDLEFLMLYDHRQIHTRSVYTHLDSLSRHLPYQVHFAPASQDQPLTFDLDMFDVIGIHYCLRLAYTWHLSPGFAEALRRFKGLKLAFISDEYDSPQTAGGWIRDLDIQLVFTHVPERDREKFYPREIVGDNVEFIPMLTGYVPTELEGRFEQQIPMEDRPIHVGYRGRELPWSYGKLAREKYTIGPQMQAACEQHEIPHDIHTDEEHRISGEAWYDFLGQCRVMLGTESGSNVLDFDGTLRPEIREWQQAHPEATFEDVHDKFLKDLDGAVEMNQVSPKTFEAAATGTALVCYEGHYSGVIQPDVHYIPLAKDGSNIEEVIRKIQDVDLLKKIAARAYEDLVASGDYSYASFVQTVEAAIRRKARPQGKREWEYAVVAVHTGDNEQRLDNPCALFSQPVCVDTIPLLQELADLRARVYAEKGFFGNGILASGWKKTPNWFRAPFRLFVKPVVLKAKALVKSGLGRRTSDNA